MISFPGSIIEFVRKLGVDKSIAYSSGARVVQAFTGVASILFIAQFLTKTEQGFYYTFGSIIAIQIFFELGLTNIITQYVAHEASHLKWTDSTHLEGEQKYHSRLAHLLRFSVKWYAVIGIIFFVVLLGAGYWFFSYYSPADEDVIWVLPWILVSIGTVLKLFIAPLMSILMGLERVKEVMKMQFYQQLIIPLSTWIGLALGWHLYVLGIASLLSVVYIVIYVNCTDLKGILGNLWRVKVTDKVSYMKEIFPYQWKIALSWVSGYFIFQLFNPVLFATEGAVVAGQMGMTLAALNGIMAFSQSWITTKVPLWSKLIALKDYVQLDRIFNTTMKQVSIVCLGLISVLVAGIWGLKALHIPLGYRFLNWLPLTLMLIPLYINQWVNGWATYLRCHKQEPFLVNSIVGGILCCLSTIILGKYFGVIGMTAGYCTIVMICSIWTHKIFNICKKKWHIYNPIL